jgi:hypothetical protein
MILFAPVAAISVLQPPAEGDRAGVTAALPQILQEFTSERSALLFRPDTTPEAYRALALRWAHSVAIPTLSLEELEQAALAGLFDFSPAREQAGERLDALATAPLATMAGARVAALRLRLFGSTTLAGSPSRETQERLLTALLEHPGLPELMRTDGAVAVVDDLCRIGRRSVIQAHGDKIAATVDLLDARAPGALDIAADLSRVAALLSLARSSDVAPRAALERLLAFGRAVAAAGESVSPKRRARIAQQVGWLEALLDGERTDEEIQTRDEETKRTMRRAASVPAWFWGLLRDASAADDPLTLRFEIARPPSEQAVFEPAPGSRVEQATFAFRQAVVSPLPDPSARAFGEVDIRDPFLRLRADEFGLDPIGNRLVTRNVSFDARPYAFRAGRIALDQDAASEIDDLRIIAFLGGTRFVTLSTPIITRDETGQTRIKDARISAFGTRLLTLRSLSFKTSSPSEEQAEKQGAPGEGAGPEAPAASEGPKGQSPASTWARLPTIGTFEGGLSVGYSNAVKFGGRWSVPFGFTFNTNAPESVDIAVNYNLLAVTNSVDRFLDEVKFEQEFWESSYFNVHSADQVKENEILFTPKLLVGVYSQKNQFRTDPDLDVHAVDVPLSARVEGGASLGRTLGFRGEVARERIEDHVEGKEERWLLLGSIGPPSARLARGVDGFLRADGGAKLGTDNYDWYRGLTGITALLWPDLRLSTAYYNSIEEGTPRFDFDRVPADHGISARADTFVGSLRLALMNQYSTRLNRWTRWQALVGLGVGGLEPYASYDQRFNRISFGLTIQLDRFTDRYLNRRYLGVGPSAPADSSAGARYK